MYPHHTSHVDLTAEREAEAIDRLADLLGEPVPFTRLQLARFHAIEAAERGLPPVRKWQYRHTEAVKAWLAILGRIARGDLATRRVVLITAESEERRHQKRLTRISLLRTLERTPNQSPPLPFRDALRASGLGERTLSRAISTGEVQAIRCGNHTFIPVRDLRRLVTRVLHPQRPTAPTGRRMAIAS